MQPNPGYAWAPKGVQSLLGPPDERPIQNPVQVNSRSIAMVCPKVANMPAKELTP